MILMMCLSIVASILGMLVWAWATPYHWLAICLAFSAGINCALLWSSWMDWRILAGLAHIGEAGRMNRIMVKWGWSALFIGTLCGFLLFFVFHTPTPRLVLPLPIGLDDLTDVGMDKTPMDGQELRYDPIRKEYKSMLPEEVLAADEAVQPSQPPCVPEETLRQSRGVRPEGVAPEEPWVFWREGFWKVAP